MLRFSGTHSQDVKSILLIPILIKKESYSGDVIRKMMSVTDSASFINCRFEECQSTEEGSLVSNWGDLVLEKTDFWKCWSKTHCGGMRKKNGALRMKCCVFDECHGEDGDDDVFGTAFGSSDCDVVCEDITLYQCWKQTSPYSDSTYGFLRGTVDVKNLNSSHCTSKNGGLIGSYYEVRKGASIQFIQGVQGQEHNAFELRNIEQIVFCMNIVNNTFTDNFLIATGATLTVVKGCFFLNNRYNDYTSLVVAIDCISDSYSKATINVQLSTAFFHVSKCRISQRFTHRSGYRPLSFMICWAFAECHSQ